VQIERALREAIRARRLAPGARIPGSRTLAQDLGVSRGVVVEAFEQLIAEGYLTARSGARTFVAEGVALRPPAAPEPRPPILRFDFRPGLPDVSLFPREEWGRALRRVMRELRPEQLAYGDPRGSAELRSALADYLGRVRGVLAPPRQVLICTGFAQALGIAARALFKSGIRRLGMEDPSHPDQRRIVSEAGLVPVAVPVDEGGLRVDGLERARLRAVLVTPAHQFPTGSVLAPERRRELLAWASRRAGFVIEDDYDAEYRYDRSPVGALQGLAADRVVYAGSASKILAPALRLGWLVVPVALLGLAAEIKTIADLGSSALDQLAYAEFLRGGELDRHLRRMRPVYERRRDALLAALARHCPRWRPVGAAAGLHLVAELPAGADEARLVREAAARSVRLYPMSHYRFGGAGSPALVLGYAHLSEGQIGAAVARMAAGRQRAPA
jgi:GntR family transcriptional regulator/MocR family aminotransferase